MKTILVTGGAGFIGSHLCEFLLEQGNKVLCLDNFVTGSKENISAFLKNENFQLIESDIVQSIPIEEKVDEIYNLACIASPPIYSKYQIETLLASSVGLKNVLDFALKNNSKILQASTSEVYGNPLEHPQKESYWGNVNSIGERSCYDESKRFSEALCMSYKRIHNVETRIARIFNTYGPKMAVHDGRAIPNFIDQALNGKPITIYGKGNFTRSFCYISDLVKGLVKLMNSNYFLPVNLGNPNEITILELAKKIIKLSNSKSKIEFLPALTDDPTRRHPDIFLAKKLLNWKPQVKLNDGLEKTIDYFKSKL